MVAAYAYARGVVFGPGGELLESGFWGFGVNVPLFKGAGGGAVVLREAPEEGEEVVCVFGCDGRFDISWDFYPACNENGW